MHGIGGLVTDNRSATGNGGLVTGDGNATGNATGNTSMLGSGTSCRSAVHAPGGALALSTVTASGACRAATIRRDCLRNEGCIPYDCAQDQYAYTAYTLHVSEHSTLLLTSAKPSGKPSDTVRPDAAQDRFPLRMEHSLGQKWHCCARG